MEHKQLQFDWKGTIFHIRAVATRGDQYDMHATMADGTEIRDGKVIKTSTSRLYPWLIKRFVTGWSKSAEKSGEKIFDEIYAEPAEPGEDLILVLGSYIMNHTGIAQTEEQVALKNG